MERRLSLAILAIFLMAQPVEPLSLGTVVKKDTVSIAVGEYARFTILFWNVDDVQEKIELEVKEAPKDWIIIVQPKEFFLNSSVGEEVLILQNKLVKTFPVNVFVKPENAKPGEYKILIKARAGLPEQGINFLQETEFKLTVKIEGEKIQEVKNEASTKIQEPLPLTEKIVEQTYSIFYYIFAVVFILVVSLLIYKYA